MSQAARDEGSALGPMVTNRRFDAQLADLIALHKEGNGQFRESLSPASQQLGLRAKLLILLGGATLSWIALAMLLHPIIN